MKKLISILLLSVMLAGCGTSSVPDAGQAVPETSSFVLVEKYPYFQVIAVRETGVMYIMSDGLYNRGTFTLLVDADGKPMIWEGVTE